MLKIYLTENLFDSTLYFHRLQLFRYPLVVIMFPTNSSRPSNTYCFIPCTPDHVDTDGLVNRAAKVTIAANESDNDCSQIAVAGLLAQRIGGRPSDLQFAEAGAGSFIVFFPTEKSRQKAIRRSPIRNDILTITVIPWEASRHTATPSFQYFVWIRLRNLPLYCHQYQELTTIVSSFGRYLWSDEASRHRENLNYYRVLIKCINPRIIPEYIILQLGNREWTIFV